MKIENVCGMKTVFILFIVLCHGCDSVEGTACAQSDCPAGPMGLPGLSCWDTNENSSCDTDEEDLDGDGACDVQDCRGPSGENGFWTLAEQGAIVYEGNVGIGVQTPQASLDIARGLRTQNMGKIIVDHDGINTSVNIGWTPDYIAEHAGESYFWAGEGPNLRDTVYCSAGGDPLIRVISDTELHGHYYATLHNISELGDSPGLSFQWQGWRMEITDLNDQVLEVGIGRIFATLAYYNGRWGVHHMSGTVNNRNFSCF